MSMICAPNQGTLPSLSHLSNHQHCQAVSYQGTMTTLQTSAPQAVPRRPRLSLRINTREVPPTTIRTAGLAVGPADSTALNTISNKYALAMDKSTTAPTQAEPITAINTTQSFTLSTSADRKSLEPGIKKARMPLLLDIPDSASIPQQPGASFPTTPASSVSTDNVKKSSSIAFSPKEASSPRSPRPLLEYRSARRHSMLRDVHPAAPYHHPRALHSILRNSPLPPRTAVPSSPRRQTPRLREKAAKRVGYNDPLTQDIVTNQYIKSHIDLLNEEASPSTPSLSIELDDMMPTQTMTEDGGQTPGPVENRGRRKTGHAPSLSTSSSSSSSSSSSPPEARGIRKRKKEKKRRWVWTIGVKDEEDEDDDEVGGAIAALRAESATKAACTSKLVLKTPTPKNLRSSLMNNYNHIGNNREFARETGDTEMVDA